MPAICSVFLTPPPPPPPSVKLALAHPSIPTLDTISSAESLSGELLVKIKVKRREAGAPQDGEPPVKKEKPENVPLAAAPEPLLLRKEPSPAASSLGISPKVGAPVFLSPSPFQHSPGTPKAVGEDDAPGSAEKSSRLDAPKDKERVEDAGRKRERSVSPLGREDVARDKPSRSPESSRVEKKHRSSPPSTNGHSRKEKMEAKEPRDSRDAGKDREREK